MNNKLNDWLRDDESWDADETDEYGMPTMEIVPAYDPDAIDPIREEMMVQRAEQLKVQRRNAYKSNPSTQTTMRNGWGERICVALVLAFTVWCLVLYAAQSSEAATLSSSVNAKSVARACARVNTAANTATYRGIVYSYSDRGGPELVWEPSTPSLVRRITRRAIELRIASGVAPGPVNVWSCMAVTK